ncbi:MAG: M3 family oligoendopeptidase [Candidatus Dojkabacteria bacterium]|jgi:oligoendopeptidase F|nr:M3 family oligoendopeptidase [Candidatus Dojkabacteria bacterium]MDD2270202.1 M3 family oligoendopeptidase [Candidatus Dojkabacteria bacterium]
MNWNLELLYKSLQDTQIEKDVKLSESAVKGFVEKWQKDSGYLKDSKILRIALYEYEKLNSEYGILTKPYYYTLLRKEIDLNNKELKARLNKLNHKATKLANEIQFFEINLSKIPKAKQKEFINSSDLKDYKHYLEMLFANAKYILTDKEERIFNLTSKTSFGNWVNMIEELLSKQSATIIDEDSKEKTVSYNEISKYLNSTNKKVRDSAAKKFNEINKKYIEIAEYEINSILESKQVSDDYRGIKRVDLPRHLGDDMDSEVVDSLVDVVSKNFNISKEYYKKKAKMLGQETLGYHERNVPVGEIDNKYDFRKGLDLVKRVFSNLDNEFGDIVEKFDRNGQYDVFPKANKTGGAYCISVNRNLPTYILLNHNDKLNDVLTIAHESGHGIHSELVKCQNSLNDSYSTAIAEVASTFFEDFVLEEVLKDVKDKKLREVILMEKRDEGISTIFRQIAFYNFEMELHTTFRKEGYLSHSEISDIFIKHMRAYLGDSVDVDDGMRYGWLYVSHFRRPFYVYTYASGLLISKYLQKKVREDKEFIKMIKGLLRAGSSKSVKSIFMDMGIDISKKDFWVEGIQGLR